MDILIVGNTFRDLMFYMDEFIKNNIPQHRIVSIRKKPGFEIKLDDGTMIKSVIAEPYAVRGRRFDKCYVQLGIDPEVFYYIENNITINSFLPKKERISYWE